MCEITDYKVGSLVEGLTFSRVKTEVGKKNKRKEETL